MSKLFSTEAIEEVRQKVDEWNEEIHHFRKGFVKDLKTLSGLPVDPLYTPAHISDMDYLRDLGFPGREPYVRGVYPTMYLGKTWTMRQLAGFGSPEETNKRLKFLLKEGATGLNIVFDYPTLRGLDSTDPFAQADVGRGGVAIDTVKDMEALFNGIPIGEISTSLVTCQPIGNISVQSMYFAYAQMEGIPPSKLAHQPEREPRIPPWFRHLRDRY